MVGHSRRVTVFAAAQLLALAILAAPTTATAAEEKRLAGPQAPTVTAVPVKGSGRPADLSQGANTNRIQRLVRWPQPGTFLIDAREQRHDRAGAHCQQGARRRSGRVGHAVGRATAQPA